MTPQDVANDPGTNLSIKTELVYFKPDSFDSDIAISRFFAQFQLTILVKWIDQYFIIQKYVDQITTMYHDILIGGMQKFENIVSTYHVNSWFVCQTCTKYFKYLIH